MVRFGSQCVLGSVAVANCKLQLLNICSCWVAITARDRWFETLPSSGASVSAANSRAVCRKAARYGAGLLRTTDRESARHYRPGEAAPGATPTEPGRHLLHIRGRTYCPA